MSVLTFGYLRRVVLGVGRRCAYRLQPSSKRPQVAYRVLVDETERQELRALFNRCETTRREMTQPGAMNPATDEMVSAVDRCSKLLPNTTIQSVKPW